MSFVLMRDLRRERALGVAVAALDLMTIISPDENLRLSFTSKKGGYFSKSGYIYG